MTLFGITINVHHYFHHPSPTDAVTIGFRLLPSRCSPLPKEITCMELKVGQTKTVQLIAKTATGAPARLDSQDGVPKWANSDDKVISLKVSDDGLTGAVTGLASGITQIGASGDANLDPDAVRIIASSPLDVMVIEEEADSIELVEVPEP